jgi:hypothetical protein
VSRELRHVSVKNTTNGWCSRRTCFLLVAGLCFRDAPYITFPSGGAADSSLNLVYNLIGLCADVRHDSLDGVLDGSHNGMFPVGNAVRTESSDSQEAEGKIQRRKAKVDAGHDPAVFLAELLEPLEEGELR